jgi:hypothetical protein
MRRPSYFGTAPDAQSGSIARPRQCHSGMRECLSPHPSGQLSADEQQISLVHRNALLVTANWGTSWISFCTSELGRQRPTTAVASPDLAKHSDRPNGMDSSPIRHSEMEWMTLNCAEMTTVDICRCEERSSRSVPTYIIPFGSVGPNCATVGRRGAADVRDVLREVRDQVLGLRTSLANGH